MAWTAPASYAVSEIITAAKLNLHIRDNLDYLKGTGGNFVLFDGTVVANGLAGNPTQGSAAHGLQSSGSGAGFVLWRRTLGSYPVSPARGDNWTIYNPDGSFRWFDNADRMVLGTTGWLGLGTVPRSPLDVYTGAGGSMLYLSGAVTGSLNTIAAAGTVAQAASFWITDYNNGTDVFLTQLPFLTIVNGASTTYVNGDTITVAVTAGGAITFQRTAGSNNHNVNVLVLCL